MTTDPHAGAELTDDALQGEIELVGDLVVAALSSEGPLSDEEIDAALGIERSRSHKDAAGEGDEGDGGDGPGAEHAGKPSAGRAGGHGSARRQHV